MALSDCDAPSTTGLTEGTDYINRLSFLRPNLIRFSRFTYSGGGYAEDPFDDYGDQDKAIVLPPGGEAHLTDRTFGAATVGHNGGAYSISFYAYIRGGDTAATVDAVFEDSGGGAITGISTQTLSITNAPTLFTWEHISSDDPDFYAAVPNNARFKFKNVAGLAVGSEIVIYDYQLQLDDYYQPRPIDLPWRPAPGEENLAYYAEYIIETNFTELAAKAGQMVVADPQSAGLVLQPHGGRQMALAAESYTLALADDGRTLRSTGATTVTVPPYASVAIPNGSEVRGRIVSGTLALVAGSGVTINVPDGMSLSLSGAGTEWRLRKVATNEWDLSLPATDGSAVAATPTMMPLAISTSPPTLVGHADGRRLIPVVWSA